MKVKQVFLAFVFIGLFFAVFVPYGEPDQIHISKGQTLQVDVEEGYHQAFYINKDKNGYPQITVEISYYMVADAYYGEPGVYEESVTYTSERDPDDRCGESFSFNYYHEGTVDSISYFQITGWNTEYGGSPPELYECYPGEEMGYGFFNYRITVTYNDFYECLDDSDCGSDHYCDESDHKCTKIEDEDDPDPPEEPECTADIDCSEGYDCMNGECVAEEEYVECTSDSDCEWGGECYDGVCGPIPNEGCCGSIALIGLASLFIVSRRVV